jgi:hypothetical protein
MAGNNRISDAGKFCVHDMKVGATNPTRAHLDANFAVFGKGVGTLHRLEKFAGSRQYHCSHLCLRRTSKAKITHAADSGEALDLDQLSNDVII